jgi:hypothetical protein
MIGIRWGGGELSFQWEGVGWASKTSWTFFDSPSLGYGSIVPFLIVDQRARMSIRKTGAWGAGADE